ncbi:unnamed protein product, partial [Protopolystoma xenopodis]
MSLVLANLKLAVEKYWPLVDTQPFHDLMLHSGIPLCSTMLIWLPHPREIDRIPYLIRAPNLWALLLDSHKQVEYSPFYSTSRSTRSYRRCDLQHQQVKQIMEEAVMRKYIHEDSGSILTLCESGLFGVGRLCWTLLASDALQLDGSLLFPAPFLWSIAFPFPLTMESDRILMASFYETLNSCTFQQSPGRSQDAYFFHLERLESKMTKHRVPRPAAQGS